MKKGTIIGTMVGILTGFTAGYLYNMSREVDEVADKVEKESLADIEKEDPNDFKEV